MKNLALLLVLGLAACNTTGAVSAPPERAEIAAEIETTAEVVALDPSLRIVTLRGEDGRLFDVYAGAEVRNFEQIEAGDVLRVRYEERLAASLLTGEEEDPVAVEAALVAGRAEPGAKPGAGVGLAVSVRVRIESIDLERDIVVFSQASGELVAHRIATPEGRAFVEGLEVGDAVRLDYSRALALTIEEL